MVTLLQRPPLAMFDPSLIHRNDEIFNPEPNRLGIFFALRFEGDYCILQSAHCEKIVSADGRVRPGALALYSSPTFLVSFAFIEPKPLLMLLPIDFTPSTVFSDVVLTTSFVF